MGVKKNLQALGIRRAYEYIDKDPMGRLPGLVDLFNKFVPEGEYSAMLDVIADVVSDPDNNWNRFVNGLWTDIDDDVRRAILENFVINSVIKWSDVNEKLQNEHDCNIPWAILIDPTSACNLKCTGCWAAEYGNKLNMSYEELDDIINQANELGVYFFLFSGGEPLVRKKDIIRLCEAHSDCQFAAFTNGTLIDEAFADEMLRVKNFMPAISVEGFEEDTDFRRGAGTFEKVEEAMAILKEKKLPFGISCCYTSMNVEMIGSEAYFDQMVDWGAKFCWFFTYMPVGVDAVPELMVSAEQRAFMYERIRAYRDTKPIFTLDFWNDGEYVPGGGCIAGGRKYFHINANGDMEPCAFIHYSDSNVRSKTLLSALQSPLFQAYRAGQPFNDNHLRPCPLLDNPERLVEMVETSGAHSTDLQNPEEVRELSAKCEEKAAQWARTADKLWECSGHCASCRESKAV